MADIQSQFLIKRNTLFSAEGPDGTDRVENASVNNFSARAVSVRDEAGRQASSNRPQRESPGGRRRQEGFVVGINGGFGLHSVVRARAGTTLS